MTLALAAFALLLCLAGWGAVVRGGPLERRGAALFTIAWLASLGAQALFRQPSPGLWLPVLDLAVLAALARLAWRSPRPWPVYACGFQTLVVAGDLAKWVNPDLDVRLHLSLLSVMAFGAVGMLALGAWLPPKVDR